MSISDVALTAPARIELRDTDREVRTFSINAHSAESRLGASRSPNAAACMGTLQTLTIAIRPSPLDTRCATNSPRDSLALGFPDRYLSALRPDGPTTGSPAASSFTCGDSKTRASLTCSGETATTSGTCQSLNGPPPFSRRYSMAPVIGVLVLLCASAPP